MEILCPHCGKKMKEHTRTAEIESFHGFGCENDYDGLFCKEYYYKCPDCKIEYSDDGWHVPKKLKKELLSESDLTDKQNRTLNFIYSRLNLKEEIFFNKEQVRQFIGDKLKIINKK